MIFFSQVFVCHAIAVVLKSSYCAYAWFKHTIHRQYIRQLPYRMRDATVVEPTKTRAHKYKVSLAPYGLYHLQ